MPVSVLDVFIRVILQDLIELVVGLTVTEFLRLHALEDVDDAGFQVVEKNGLFPFHEIFYQRLDAL